MQVDIRPCTAEDAEALALVGAATFLETYADELAGGDIVAHCREKHAAAVYRERLEAGWRAWLAEAPRGAPVGYLLLGPTDLPEAGAGDLEAHRIYVLSRLHGTGLGARLMAEAVAHCRATGAPRLLLGVYARNTRALAFYERQGFRRIGVRSFTVGGATFDDDQVLALAV